MSPDLQLYLLKLYNYGIKAGLNCHESASMVMRFIKGLLSAPGSSSSSEV